MAASNPQSKPTLIYTIKFPGSSVYTSIQFRNDPNVPATVDMIYNHTGGEVQVFTVDREMGRTLWKNMVSVGAEVDSEVGVVYPSV